MPIARFQLPDGRIARFEVPEGTTPEQAQSLIQAQLPSFGLTTAPTTPIAPVRPERTMGQALGDTGVQLAEGVNTLLGSGFSLFAPEGDIAKSFERGAEYWREKQSEPFKQRMAAADVSIQKAGEEGVISQIVEAASQYYDDPALAARFVVTNLPSMIPGLGVAKLTQAAALARGATAAKAAGLATTSAGGVNAILNAGGARAEAFQDIKKTLIEQGYSPAEAERKAIEDSRLVAAVGGATGFISGKTGLEKVITGGLTKGGLRGVAGRVAGELAGEQAEEVLPKLATNIQAAEYDARSLGKDIGRTIVETGIASGPGAALSGVMGRAPEAPITDKSRAANTVEQTPDGQLKILVNGVADTPPVAPEVQEVRDRLTARGFSEEDIDRILAERAMREAPAAVKEPTDATATTLPADVPAVTEAQPGVGEPSVGVPSGDLGRPATAEPAAPVGRGLERPVTPPEARVEPETTIPTELTETPRGTQAPETIQAKEEGSAQPAAPAPTAVEAPAPTPPVKLYRGVPQGKESQPTVGGALFMSPDQNVARTYAGAKGTITEKEISFNNLLDAKSWVDAKDKLGLPKSTTMEGVVNAARKTGYDGVTFNTTNGREYIVIDQPAAPAPTAVEAPAATPPVEEKPARYQRLRAEQPWYSALDKAIEASPQKAAPAPQWKNVLTGMVNKGQAKRDEIEWTGVEDWLALQQGRVTKEQVQNYLKQGGVKVEETVLSEPSRQTEYDIVEADNGYAVTADGKVVVDGFKDYGDAEDWIQEGRSDRTAGDTKYSQYTLPGGENYREVLLTLPTQAAPVEGKIVKDGKDSKYPWAIIVNGEEVNRVSDEAVAKDVLEGELTRARKQRGKEDSSTYQSSHWDQPNVIAHIRVNDRTDADGNKVLFVEEIQSDWGQERKKNLRMAEESGSQMVREGAEAKTPNAPFIGKTEGWLNLALKRVLTMAAEGGYDRVAFTTGDQNAERYDLSKQIEMITAYKQTGGGFKISATDINGNTLPSQKAKDEAELGGIVGKELADKIASQKSVVEQYRGLDLKVGGEGMKTFYDQIIPNALKKLLPKVGDGQMGQVAVAIPQGNGEKTAVDVSNATAQSQPGFDITPAMREKLAGGLPLFQKEGKEQPPQKTGKYPLPAQAIEDLKGNNLALALEAIETSKPSEINKAIATRLKVLLKNTKVTIDDDLRDSKGNPVLGAASTSGSRIWLDVNRGMNMETVLHESVHAATERILSTPENQRTPQQNEAVRELTDLWNAAKANSAINLTPEASDSLSEFVAEGMTNIELQDQLASVKWESRTMWAGFKRILLNMLGVKTPASMLDYTLASVDTIFAAVPTAPTSTPAQTTTKPKVKQTETKAFKRWFGDSKVVDENGEPLVVYHGTNENISAFDPDKIGRRDAGFFGSGFYLTANEDEALDYADSAVEDAGKGEAQTIALYASLQNPFIWDMSPEGEPATRQSLANMGIRRDSARGNSAALSNVKERDVFNRAVRERGYDGVIVRDEDGVLEVVAFRPEQIKSAIGNIGTFDPASPDIRYQKPKLTAEEKAKKDAEEADAAVKEAMEKFAKSKTSEEAAKAASTLQSLRSSTTAIPQLRRLYDSVSNLGRRRLVQVLPIDFLAELASKNVPELQRTTSLLGRMSGMREQLLHGASQTSDRISRAFKKDPLLRGRLEEVVYVSTLAQIDPSTNKVNPRLNTLYKALGEEGQAIYKDVRDYYTDMGDLYSQLIKSNVERSEASEESKAAILAKLKVMFEPANRMRPYFPLMREGNYWFSSGKGKNRRFHMFETMPERDAALEALARSEGKSLQDMKETSEVKFGNDVSSLREISQNTDQSLTDVLALIGKLDTGSAASKKELLDSVYQMYLNSLPEQSFRKHYITREGVAGFRTDFLRNFSQSAIQMSGQLARVKYGPQIRASLSGAKASIENQPQYEPYVEEMTKRAERDLVPPARTSLDAVSDVLTKWTYIHYLSSASSALLQPVGILQTALPVLGGRYGYGKTAAEVAKLAKVWDSFSTTRNLPDGTTTTVFPTVANSKAVNASPLEKQAIKEMLARDVSQSTMARELYGYRAKPTDRVNTKLDKGIKGANFLMGGLMHHTERVAREIVFLASYRLNIEAGKSHETAVDAAVKDTQDSLGNYSQYARPLIMRNPVGKVVLQFSTYPLHIASFLVNNFYKMIPILNKEGKAEAAKIFFGTLGTTWILAGAAGFPAPVSAVLMGFISVMFKALGDDEEMPDEMRKQDFTKWFNEIWLPSQLGHIEVFGHKLSDVVKTGIVNVAGWDFASRTGLNNLFLREQKETKTPREGLQAALIDKSGPSINMILSYADGVQAFKEGDYQRAVEKIAPAAVRSVAQTYKFATEGAKDIKGNELITKGDFTTGELIGRFIGFQPSKLANLQKVNAEVKQEETKMNNERNLILRKYDIAKRKDADLDSIFEEIDAYNAKYPTNAISGFALSRYLKDKAKERAKSQQGVTVTKKTPIDVREMIDLSRNYGISKKEGSTSTPDYGLRVDKTPKAQGFFGELKRPDGDISTELSIGVNIGGKEMEIPAIVPTLTKRELNFLLSDGPSGDPIMQSIEDKAVEHAKKRIKAGLSPFATPNERVLPTPK